MLRHKLLISVVYLVCAKLLAWQNLALHFLHLLLVHDEGCSLSSHLSLSGRHLLVVLLIHRMTWMARVRKLFELVARGDVSVLLSSIQDVVWILHSRHSSVEGVKVLYAVNLTLSFYLFNAVHMVLGYLSVLSRQLRLQAILVDGFAVQTLQLMLLLHIYNIILHF